MLTCNGGVSWPHQLRVRSYGQPWWPAVYEEPFLQWTYGRSALYEPLRQITWRTKCLVNNSLLFILIVQCSKFVKKLLHYQVAVIRFATEHRHICPNISSLVNWKINIVFVFVLHTCTNTPCPSSTNHNVEPFCLFNFTNHQHVSQKLTNETFILGGWGRDKPLNSRLLARGYGRRPNWIQ